MVTDTGGTWDNKSGYNKYAGLYLYRHVYIYITAYR